MGDLQGQLVVAERDQLRQPEEPDPRLSLARLGDELFEDEQMPELVVLLRAALRDSVVDGAGPSPAARACG